MIFEDFCVISIACFAVWVLLSVMWYVDKNIDLESHWKNKYHWLTVQTGVNILLIPLIWLSLSYYNLNREYISVEKKIYKYEDIPAIIIEDNIKPIAGKKNKNWNEDFLIIRICVDTYSYGIIYPSMWEIENVARL